jgi:hypothetical protein
LYRWVPSIHGKRGVFLQGIAKVYPGLPCKVTPVVMYRLYTYLRLKENKLVRLVFV